MLFDKLHTKQLFFKSSSFRQIKPEPNIGHTDHFASDDSDLSDDDSPKKRRDLLTRRPSYRKILNDLGGGEIGKNSLMTCLYVCF